MMKGEPRGRGKGGHGRLRRRKGLMSLLGVGQVSMGEREERRQKEEVTEESCSHDGDPGGAYPSHGGEGAEYISPNSHDEDKRG